MDKDKTEKTGQDPKVGFPRVLDAGPNAFNDNEMADDVLRPRVPEGTKPAGKPRDRESG